MNPNRFVYTPALKAVLSQKAREYKWTDDQKAQHSDLMKKVVIDNPESYSASNVSGRVKSYNYNGLVLKGQWELLVAKKLHSEEIKFTNKIDPIPYVWKETNKVHLYFPDFYLSDYDIFIEVKGYEHYAIMINGNPSRIS